MNTAFNTRVLVIDDEEAVRNSFREILVPTRRDFSALEAASSSLFGEETRPKPSNELFRFHLDEADTGARGVELVSAAAAEGRPYAVIFVDMRMPGWDGLDTVRHIRKYDKRAEIIFITAYSDYSIEEVVAKAGANVGYHTKPFSPEEIRQLATKGVYEWNKTCGLENLIHVMSDLRTTEAELDLLLNNILHQVADLVGSRSALLAVREGERYSKLIGIGALADDETALKNLESLPAVQGDSVYQSEDFIYFPLDRYGVFALFESDAAPLRNDRIYMVQLFLEQATQAIHNAELQEELIRSEKLSAMGKGVSVVAHDLRNPLGNILSLVSLIETESGEDAESKGQIHEYLSLIRHSAENATDIVNDILDFTRDTKVQGSPVPVDQILERVDRDVRQAAEDRGVQVRIEYPDAGFVVQADASKMERVLLNLTRNAVEAMAGTDADANEVTITAHTDGADAIFHVDDTGPGIPQDVQDHLFVPFATVGKRGGTGLGLPIAKQFVQAHNGTINMSTSEEGTRFTIRLPDRVRPHATAETAG